MSEFEHGEIDADLPPTARQIEAAEDIIEEFNDIIKQTCELLKSSANIFGVNPLKPDLEALFREFLLDHYCGEEYVAALITARV